MSSHNQTKSVFDLLPEEAWLLAFKKLQNPADIYACFEACTEWKNILRSRKSLCATLIFYKYLPFLYKYLSLKDLLKCRLVSKQWKCELDSFLEHEQANMPVLNAKFLWILGLHFVPLTRSLKVKLDLTRNANFTLFPRTIADFQLEISNFKEIPSSLHTVCVSDFHRQEIAKVSQDLLPFFKKFGIYIKHLCLHLELVPPGSFLVYLQTLLANTPNLKSLAISECLLGGLNVPGCIKISRESRLPVLPNLQLLELDAQNSVIRRFVLQTLLTRSSENLANLSVVSVSIYSNHELLILQSASFAVTELHLYIESPDVSLAEVLKTPEHFNKSLKILKISKPNIESSSTVLKRVELPNVEELSLLNVDLAYPLVLNYMDLKKLQRLTLHSLSSYRGNPNKVYVLFQARLCCNLWTSFRDLKQVRIIGLDGSIKVVGRPKFQNYVVSDQHLNSIYSERETGRGNDRMNTGIRRRLITVRSYSRSLCKPMLKLFCK